jgi:hypothetical protein
MQFPRPRGWLVLGAGALLIVAFGVRFFDSQIADWSTAHSEGPGRGEVRVLTFLLTALPTVLQITALCLATVALLGVSRHARLWVPTLWALLTVLLGLMAQPALKSWAAARLPAPLWRAWSMLSAGQVSALSHGFGAGRLAAALIGAGVGAVWLTALYRGNTRITGVTILCLTPPRGRLPATESSKLGRDGPPELWQAPRSSSR